MSSETYRVILTGQVLAGYDPLAVAQGVCRLLKLPESRAQTLFTGKPICLVGGIEREKAEQLQERLITRGAECLVEVGEAAKEAPERGMSKGRVEPAGVKSVDKPGFGELSLAPVEAKASGEVNDESQDIEGSLDECLLLDMEMPGLPGSDEAKALNTGPAEADSTAPAPGQGQSDPADTGQYLGDPGTVPLPQGKGKRPAVSPNVIKLGMGSAALAILLGVWWVVQGLLFADPEIDVSSTPVTAQPERVADPKRRLTDQRLKSLSQSVKVWMIQYGSGFDPAQVTLQRLQQDLSISRDDIIDGWGVRIDYQPAENGFTLRSAGPDGEFANGDDVTLSGRIQ